MTPTEKRLREALKTILAGAEVAVIDCPPMDAYSALNGVSCVAREALAAIPSETGREDDNVVHRLRRRGHPYSIGGGALFNPDGEDGASRIESLQAQLASAHDHADAAQAGYEDRLASLRERVVEECAEIIDDYCSEYNMDTSDLEECAKQIRALAKSPPVTGEKEKSDGPHL